MKVQPLFDYVLVKPVKADDVTKSGIVLPDTVNKEKPQMGEVVAVGPGVTNDDGKVMPMVVTVGQIVYYKKWGGNEIKIDNVEHMLIEQKDIMAIAA